MKVLYCWTEYNFVIWLLMLTGLAFDERTKLGSSCLRSLQNIDGSAQHRPTPETRCLCRFRFLCFASCHFGFPQRQSQGNNTIISWPTNMHIYPQVIIVLHEPTFIAFNSWLRHHNVFDFFFKKNYILYSSLLYELDRCWPQHSTLLLVVVALILRSPINWPNPSTNQEAT